MPGGERGAKAGGPLWRGMEQGGQGRSPGAEYSRKEPSTRGKCSTAGASGQAGSRNKWHSRGWRCSSGLGEMGGKGMPCAWHSWPRSCSGCVAGGGRLRHGGLSAQMPNPTQAAPQGQARRGKVLEP